MMPGYAIDGLSDPSIQQATYRKVLRALSYPGTTVSLFSQSETSALSSVTPVDGLPLILATLLDASVSCADPSDLVSDDLKLFLGYRSSTISNADFVLASGETPWSESETPRIGDLFNPHLGATVILLCERLGEGPIEFEISGPGVKDSQLLAACGLDPEWIDCRNQWVSKFPMGVDVILCDSERVAGLPRTSIVKAVLHEPGVS